MLNLLQSDVKTMLFTKQDLISESHSVPVKIATGDIDGIWHIGQIAHPFAYL